MASPRRMPHTATRRGKRVRVQLHDGRVILAKFLDRNNRTVFLTSESDGDTIRISKKDIKAMSDYKERPTTQSVEAPAVPVTLTNDDKKGIRMAAKQQHRVKEMGLLGSLLKAADVPVVKSNAREHPHLKDIKEGDPLEMAVVRVMADGMDYSVFQVVTILKDLYEDSHAIRMTMQRLHTEGVLARNRDVYTVKKSSVKSFLEEGFTKTTTNGSLKPFELKEPNVSAPDEMGIIRLSDGIDLCVWKIMQDRNWREFADVISIAASYGNINRAIWRNRMAALVKKSWFDVRQYGQGNQYRLKKHIQPPAAETPEVKPLIPTKGPHTYPTDKLAGASSVNPILNAVAGELIHSAGIANLPNDEVQDIASTPGFGDGLADHSTEDVAQRMAEELLTSREPIAINSGDSVRVAIWKVMCDLKEYSAADVALLLEDFDYKATTVKPYMTILMREGWFERFEHRTGTTNRLTYTYRLKAEIPNPDVIPTEVLEEIEATTNEVPQQEQLDLTQPSNETTMSNVTAIHQPNSALEEPQLYNVSITLKGIPFTVAEAHQLSEELLGAGYGASNVLPRSKMFERTVTLRGKTFTEEELDTVSKRLLEDGFGN